MTQLHHAAGGVLAHCAAVWLKWADLRSYKARNICLAPQQILIEKAVKSSLQATAVLPI